jgi:hypothetical protein
MSKRSLKRLLSNLFHRSERVLKMFQYHINRLRSARKTVEVRSAKDVQDFTNAIAKQACEEIVEAVKSLGKDGIAPEIGAAIAVDRFVGHVVDSILGERSVAQKVDAPVE